MKNMKKTIVGVAILMIAVIAMMGSVHAASTTISNTEIKKGDTVTVTVKTDADVYGIQFNLAYHTKYFKYKGAEAKPLDVVDNDTQNGEEGLIKVLASSGNNEGSHVTLTFEALEDTANVVKDFVVSNFKAGGETLSNDTVSVKVDKTETQKPTTPEQNNNNQPNKETDKTQASGEATKQTTQKAGEKIGTNGKVITKLPQTGTPIFMGVVALFVVGSVVFIVKKIK